jgi:hypothetical protein
VCKITKLQRYLKNSWKIDAFELLLATGSRFYSTIHLEEICGLQEASNRKH